ncbi:MAG: hypothetical protein P1U80_02325 [Pseudomonadales bacterium]|nr:hypothetical protein [Pseudomonadales bacterium]
MKSNDVLFLLVGLAIAAFGIKVIIRPGYESFRFGAVSFGDYHQLIGAAILVIGGLSIFSVFIKK